MVIFQELYLISNLTYLLSQDLRYNEHAFILPHVNCYKFNNLEIYSGKLSSNQEHAKECMSLLGKISGPYGYKYEDCCLLGCSSVQSGKYW